MSTIIVVTIVDEAGKVETAIPLIGPTVLVTRVPATPIIRTTSTVEVIVAGTSVVQSAEFDTEAGY